jgi:ribosomal protein S18 acetylase RimI-like enzyme
MLRQATDADLDAVTALALAEEIAWFGEPENSPAEVVEWLNFHGGAERGVVAADGERLRGFATASADGNTALVVDPGEDEPAYDELIPWLTEHGGKHVELFPKDLRRKAWLEQHGWKHTRSSFDLVRPGDALVDAAHWPEGVTVEPYDDNDAEAVHRLIYVEAGWAEVPGHAERGLDAWRGWFTDAFRRWVTRRDGRPIGWVASKVFDDGHGWVFQIAVVKDERRGGLGRALLLHAFADLLASGARAVGLSVQGENEHAIGLYTSIGLIVEKEWQIYQPT